MEGKREEEERGGDSTPMIGERGGGGRMGNKAVTTLFLSLSSSEPHLSPDPHA